MPEAMPARRLRLGPRRAGLVVDDAEAVVQPVDPIDHAPERSVGPLGSARVNGGCSSPPKRCSTASSVRRGLVGVERPNDVAHDPPLLDLPQDRVRGEPLSSNSCEHLVGDPLDRVARGQRPREELRRERPVGRRREKRSRCSRPRPSSTLWTSEPRWRASSSSTSSMSSCSRTPSTFLKRYLAGQPAHVSNAVADRTVSPIASSSWSPTLALPLGEFGRFLGRRSPRSPA